MIANSIYFENSNLNGTVVIQQYIILLVFRQRIKFLLKVEQEPIPCFFLDYLSL